MSEALSVDDIEGLYARYGSAIRYRCQQLLRDDAASWDAMHQTFVRAIRYRRSFKGDNPRAWLYSIAHRVCVDELRRGGRAELTDEEPPDQTLKTETMEARLMQQDLVSRLLAHFGPKIQRIVVLRYFDGLEVKDIASRTGLSERTVARRLSQFLSRSRKILEAKS